MGAFLCLPINHFISIIYSPSSDKYYTGQTHNLQQRILAHNSKDGHRFTSKYQPWILKAYFSFENRANARLMENYIKKEKAKLSSFGSSIITMDKPF